MRFLRNQSLRRQVLVATLALLVPFGAVMVWSFARTNVEQERGLRDEAGAIASAAAASLTQYFTGVDAMAASLARHPAVMALDRSGADELLSHAVGHEPLLLNIVLTDRAGVLKGSARRERASVSAIVALPYVGDVIAGGKPVVSDLTSGAVTGTPAVILGYPVTGQDGVAIGVLGFGIDLARLQTLFASVPLPAGSVVTVTDRTGHVLTRSRDAARYIGRVSAVRPAEPADVPRTQLLVGLDGIERVYGNAVIDRGPWLLSVGIPTAVASAGIAPLRRRNAIIVTVGISAFLALSLLLAHLLSRSLDRLRAAAQRIADGDLSPPAESHAPNREIGQLHDAFVRMAASLRGAQGALDRQIEQERRIREALQSLQRQVVRQERLAAVGVLVSGVAHELNNPLQAILGTAELVEREPGLPHAALEELSFIKTQSNRARDIIRNLSRFSSQQAAAPSPIDVREVVAEVAQLRRRNLQDSNITLLIDAADPRHVHANFTELEQVILNFVINAQQAIESRRGKRSGRIAIRMFDSGRKVRVEVADDGPGVSAQDEAKLFQPFFTTKPVGQGTGLGLSVSYGIIESYGGVIGHHGNEWGGATFFFELPVDHPSLLRRPEPDRV